MLFRIRSNRVWSVSAILLACLLAALAAGCSDSPTGPAGPGILGDVTWSTSFASAGASDELEYRVTLKGAGGAPDIVLLDQVIHDGDAGKYFTVLDSSNPSFQDLVGRLTDGVDGYVNVAWLTTSSSASYTTQESRYFRIPSPTAVDFEGYRLSSITLFVEHSSIKPWGTDGHSFDVRARVEVMGDVSPPTDGSILP